MGWTGIPQVRNHLYRLEIGEDEVRNRSVRLTSDDYVKLPHLHITESSETVKAVIQSTPVTETIVPGDDPTPLSHAQIAADSVVCAADSSLSVVYEENIDFVIDYAAGAVRRVEGGSIPTGVPITIWYVFYHVYQRTLDYYIDYERGRIRRTTTGGIEDGQEILIDYQSAGAEFSDSEIEQAINDAETEMKQEIDAAYEHATDPGLQTAATYLALSLLCRNAAGLATSGSGGTDAKSWIELSVSYRETAMRLLSWFRRQSPGLNSPKLT
jgi:hypothetical protein